MSVADKLITIANNTPLVCENSSTRKTVSGNPIVVEDVLWTEHKLKIKLTSDTITDFTGINVSRCGKNLFTNELITNSGESTIERPDANSCVIKAIGKSTCYQGFCLKVPESEVFTLSLKVLTENTPVLQNGRVNSIYIWKRPNSDFGHSPNVFVTSYNTNAIDGEQKEIKLTLQSKQFEGYSYMQISWYAYSSPLSQIPEKWYRATLTDIQLEMGSTATEYEPYKELRNVTSNSEGVAEGLRSVSPIMTLMSENNINIECTYKTEVNPNITEKFIELQEAFAVIKKHA